MSDVLTAVKTNFTSGELGKDLYGRGDLNVYENGARNLENVIIHTSGGVSRRKGMKMLHKLSGKARLIPFEFNTEQTYLLCLMNGVCKVYKNGVQVAELSTPWNEEQIFQLKYTQSADTLLLLHKDVAPRKITRNANEVWTIETWSYYIDEGLYCCPYYNFSDGSIKLKPNATSGNTYITSNTAFFVSNHVGSRLRLLDGCAIITSYESATKVNVTVEKNFSSANETASWEESAFSDLRGWPVCATFHQDRLIIGGSKSLPNHIWMSKTSDMFNFDYGTGLDDEAIDCSLLSDQVNAIRAIISAKNLVVFTSGAEWVIRGDNLTPEGLTVSRQTTVGMYGKKSVIPVSANGALIFVSSDGNQMQQFLYNELEDAYQATNLSLLAGEIINNPQDIAFSSSENVVYVVMQDGTISCLTTYRSEQVTAWSRLKTQGDFISVATIEDEIYFCVLRNGNYFLEILSKDAYLDSFRVLSSEQPTKTWQNLDDFEGMKVGVVANGYYVGKYEVENGTINVSEEANSIIVGLPYEHLIEPLPFVNPYRVPLSPHALRVVSAVFRIIDSKGFCVDLGGGYSEVPLRKISNQTNFDSDLQSFSGDIELYALGWVRDINKPLWSIKSDVPVEFTLLSTSMKIQTK